MVGERWTSWGPPLVVLALLTAGCATDDPKDPSLKGVYQTWDDVIARWIGQPKDKLFYEIGPPNFHQKESSDGYTEMMWDMTIPSMPGQAEAFNTLPLYGADVNCKLIFIADQDGLVSTLAIVSTVGGATSDRFPILADTTYLVTHSLGAMPRAVYRKLADFADQWATRGEATDATLFEWLTARGQALRARREFLSALLRYSESVVDLETVTGAPLSRPAQNQENK